MPSKRKTFYVYHGDTLVAIYECYSAEGACDWAYTLGGIPRSELTAQSTPKDALGGC